MWQEPSLLRSLSMPCVLLALAGGCATGLGPKAVRSERPDYNRQIVRSNDAELLLNLVRLRYNDSMLFLGTGGAVAQYSYDASLSAGGTAGGGTASSGTLGTTLAYGEKPTITYTPLTGEECAARLLAPIPLDSVMLFEQGGWSADRLLLLTVQRVNDVFNAPTAGGPTPSRQPDYEAFADLAERMERLREAGLMGLNWEQKEHETDVPGRNPRFWIHQPANPWRQTSPRSAVRSTSRPATTSSCSRHSRTSGSPPRSVCDAAPCSACSTSSRNRWRCRRRMSRQDWSRSPRMTTGSRSTGL